MLEYYLALNVMGKYEIHVNQENKGSYKNHADLERKERRARKESRRDLGKH